MNELIYKCSELMDSLNIDYAICGGYAIDLFCRYNTRTHYDIDVSVYLDDREDIIKKMIKSGWNVYEPIGNEKIHKIEDIYSQVKIKSNIFCVKDDCEFFHITPYEDNIFHLDIKHIPQSKLNFIEFLFNNKTKNDFLYRRNHNIKRPLCKSILNYNEINYLCPEIVLLYKSTSIQNEGYEDDFFRAIKLLDNEIKDWLKEALETYFPKGHKWLEYLKENA